MKLFSIKKSSKRQGPETNGLNELTKPTPSTIKANDDNSDIATKRTIENIRADLKVVFENNRRLPDDTSQAIIYKNKAVKEYIATQMAELGLPPLKIREILNLQ